MARWKIQVEETLHFMHDVYLETDLKEEQLDAVLDEVQDKLRYPDRLDDVNYRLEEEGLKVVDYTRDEDGSYGDIEINDMEEVK